MPRRKAPYGSWTSPITPELLTGKAIGLSSVLSDGEDLYWLEGRPSEGGRSVVVRRTPSGEIADVTPAGMNVRTRVHEYGGGAFTVRDGVVFFTNFEDQRLYRQEGDAAPVALTPEPPRPGSIRYADMTVSPDGRILACVRETHPEEGEAKNEIVTLPVYGGADPAVLAGGRDFYSFPRFSPDGAELVWTEWDHPDMPWDATELKRGRLVEGEVGEVVTVAGGPGESIFQPSFDPDGILHFVSDRTGWGNLYRVVDREVHPLTEVEAELSEPQWQFGQSSYVFLPDGRILCRYRRDGIHRLALVDAENGSLRELETPWSYFMNIGASGSKAHFVAGGPTTPVEVATFDVDSGVIEVVKRSLSVDLPEKALSRPEPITFPTSEGMEAHALYYPPASAEFEGLDGENPPLLVLSHGGPTSEHGSELSLSIQFWTSRGIAVADVNYRGSTGYGRAYREALNGRWGVADMEDCANAAKFLVSRGDVDGDRLAIRGGSAGGYTTLCALVFDDTFDAGASYYGVADAETLATDTHKFESRYLDRLIGPYPEKKELYRERSPIHFADRVSCPVILFQGLEDKVVPPSQAEAFVAALEENGIPHRYVPFEGEQHGFRKAETIQTALREELAFYGEVFGFPPA